MAAGDLGVPGFEQTAAVVRGLEEGQSVAHIGLNVAADGLPGPNPCKAVNVVQGAGAGAGLLGMAARNLDDAVETARKKADDIPAPKGARVVDDAVGAVGRQPNRIYSARELIRRGDGAHHGARPEPYHNFPKSFNESIFDHGTRRNIPDFFTTPKHGLSNDSIQYTLRGTIYGREGVFEIFVRPSVSGRTEVITHRFFNPKKP